MTPPKLLNNVKFLQKCIVVDKGGKILALRRDPNDVRRPNCRGLPRRHYEEGESIDECTGGNLTKKPVSSPNQ